MKTYVVGGAVRDELLGLPVKDRDHVVVGSSAEEMARLGFRPVGKDFPVFLHPETHEEYALARTERKSGRGYKGFTVYAAPDVTLEDDLRRRDLTINAMARDESGALVDPFGGRKDLEAGVLRHVSEAFAEDPVRILRVARFAARFGFAVAPETMALMRQMVSSGETEHLVPERVWQEFAKGLMEAKPALLFAVLEDCGYLARHHPGLRVDAQALQRAADSGASLPVRFAAITGSEYIFPPDALKAPNEVRELAILFSRAYRLILQAATPEQKLALLKQADAFRRPERFDELLQAACIVDPSQAMGAAAERLRADLKAVRAINAGEVAASVSDPRDIPAAIDKVRLAVLGMKP